MADPVGFDLIVATSERLIAAIDEGFTAADYTEQVLGLDRDGVEKAAREAAEEEFMKIRSVGIAAGRLRYVPSEGRLRSIGLSARQRELVKEALTETYLLAFQTATLIQQGRTGGEGG